MTRSQHAVTFLVSFAQCALAFESQRATITPIQKVIELLNGMISKAKQEKENEQVTFREFKHWCELTRADKTRLISAASDDIVQLDADLRTAGADADKLGVEIKSLDGNVDSWETEVGKVKKVRASEHAEYEAAHADYSESIDAIERAVVVLSERSVNVRQSPVSLLELRRIASLQHVPLATRHALTLLLQTSDRNRQPEANAYEFQSSGVVGMLEKLKQKFVAERQALEKDEVNRKANSDVMLQKLNDDIGYAQKSRSDKAASRGERGEAAAQGKGDLSEIQRGLAADKAYLQEVTTECSQRSSDYESCQSTRAAEIEALQKAHQIISSPAVSGAGDTHLPASFLAVSAKQAPAVLAQVRGASQPAPLRTKVAAFLMHRAQEAKSQLLAEVAERMGQDPFAKVKKMIEDLVAKLVEEAGAEADHKGWCDTEFATNKQTREIKSAEVDDLTAKTDELTALTEKLQQEISDLGQAIQEARTDVVQRTEDRQREKAENGVTIADAKAALVAVSEATTILKEFYAQGSSFVQANVDHREVASEPYQGMQGESSGVLGMLAVIASDFARLEAQTSSAEDEAQRAFEVFSNSVADDVAIKETESRHKSFQRNGAERDFNQAKKELEGTQTELIAAIDHFDKLKPACFAEAPSYEERVKRRKEEIASLREALDVLSSNAVGF